MFLYGCREEEEREPLGLKMCDCTHTGHFPLKLHQFWLLFLRVKMFVNFALFPLIDKGRIVDSLKIKQNTSKTQAFGKNHSPKACNNNKDKVNDNDNNYRLTFVSKPVNKRLVYCCSSWDKKHIKHLKVFIKFLNS